MEQFCCLLWSEGWEAVDGVDVEAWRRGEEEVRRLHSRGGFKVVPSDFRSIVAGGDGFLLKSCLDLR